MLMRGPLMGAWVTMVETVDGQSVRYYAFLEDDEALNRAADDLEAPVDY